MGEYAPTNAIKKIAFYVKKQFQRRYDVIKKISFSVLLPERFGAVVVPFAPSAPCVQGFSGITPPAVWQSPFRTHLRKTHILYHFFVCLSRETVGDFVKRIFVAYDLQGQTGGLNCFGNIPLLPKRRGRRHIGSPYRCSPSVRPAKCRG